MMTNLDEFLVELGQKHQAHLKEAADARQQTEYHEHEADIIAAEIRGIERARAALATPQAGNGATPPRQRKPRRDIRALVAGYEPWQPPEVIAAAIGCRVSQVRKALAAIEKDTT